MIAGVSLILILGVLNLLLILFQMSTGLQWVKVPFRVHRRTGGVLLLSAAIHAYLALFG